jgi:hypothetical protein
MGKAARAFAETQSWDAMMDEVIDIYAELIAQYSRSGVEERVGVG